MRACARAGEFRECPEMFVRPRWRLAAGAFRVPRPAVVVTEVGFRFSPLLFMGLIARVAAGDAVGARSAHRTHSLRAEERH